MTVLDQLVFFAGLYGVPRDVAAREARRGSRASASPSSPTGAPRSSRRATSRRSSSSRRSCTTREVLLMDEPFTGLDPVNVALLREAFLELRDRGKTIVFSTHQMETVEAMCESVAIVDRGRVVVGGSLRDVKRSTGRRIVKLSVEGDHRLEWLAEVPGARVVRPGIDRSEIELDPGVEPETVLAAALAAGARVTHFEIADPSLEQVFIEHVGRPAADETTLAPAPAASSTASRADGRPDPRHDQAPAASSRSRPAPAERLARRPARVRRARPQPAVPRVDDPPRDRSPSWWPSRRCSSRPSTARRRPRSPSSRPRMCWRSAPIDDHDRRPQRPAPAKPRAQPLRRSCASLDGEQALVDVGEAGYDGALVATRRPTGRIDFTLLHRREHRRRPDPARFGRHAGGRHPRLDVGEPTERPAVPDADARRGRGVRPERRRRTDLDAPTSPAGGSSGSCSSS